MKKIISFIGGLAVAAVGISTVAAFTVPAPQVTTTTISCTNTVTGKAYVQINGGSMVLSQCDANNNVTITVTPVSTRSPLF